MTAGKFCWRYPDSELYKSDEYDTRGDAIFAALTEMKKFSETFIPNLPYGGKKVDHFFVAETVGYNNDEFIDIESLTEQAICQAGDVVSDELVEDYLTLNKEDSDELKKMICDFLDRKGYTPDFYGIKNEERINI